MANTLEITKEIEKVSNDINTLANSMLSSGMGRGRNLRRYRELVAIKKKLEKEKLAKELFG